MNRKIADKRTACLFSFISLSIVFSRSSFFFCPRLMRSALRNQTENKKINKKQQWNIPH